MKVPKPIKPLKNAHASNDKTGRGDSYGSGVRNPVGKSKEIMGVKPMMAKSKKGYPKTLA